MVFEVYDVRTGEVLATTSDELGAQALTVGVEIAGYRWAGDGPEPPPRDPQDDYWRAKRTTRLAQLRGLSSPPQVER